MLTFWFLSGYIDCANIYTYIYSAQCPQVGVFDHFTLTLQAQSHINPLLIPLCKMTSYIDFQNSWGSDLEKDEQIRQECAVWETNPEPSYKTNETDEPDFEPEPKGQPWDYDTLLKCV